MLDEDSHEALCAAGHGAVDDDRRVRLSVFADVLAAEALRLNEVDLDR